MRKLKENYVVLIMHKKGALGVVVKDIYGYLCVKHLSSMFPSSIQPPAVTWGVENLFYIGKL